jgi:hypothetical protein
MTQITFSLVSAMIGVGYLGMVPLYVISETISGGETQFLQDQPSGYVIPTGAQRRGGIPTTTLTRNDFDLRRF